MPRPFQHLLVNAYAQSPIQQMLGESPNAIRGLSAADAQRLHDAFGIDTIQEFAENRYVRVAQAVAAAAGRTSYDPGPPPEWEQLFSNAPLDHYRNHLSGRFRTDFGPVFYRGRLDRTARLLVVGQDPATDEILSQRAFVGRAGQTAQGLLARIGITRSYLMFNTFLFGIFQQFDTEMRAITQEAPVLDYRNQVLDRAAGENPIQAMIAFGAAARDALDRWPGIPAGVPRFDLTHPSAPENIVMSDWNHDLVALSNAIDPDDDGIVNTAPFVAGFQVAESLPIPRCDLPFGTPAWHGMGGTRSQRNGNKVIEWTAQ